MFVLVNLKAYRCEPVTIAWAATDAAADLGIEIAVAGQAVDLPSIAETGAVTWAQHISPTGPGSHTGSVEAGRLTDHGVTGTLVNHSERRLRLSAIEDAIAHAETVGLESCVCASTPDQTAAVTSLGPDVVAIEPPELIGSGTPVSRADPDIVLDAIDAARTIDPGVSVLCGAGISTADDVAAAADLGADGVLVSSAVATHDDPASALRSLVDPLG